MDNDNTPPPKEATESTPLIIPSDETPTGTPAVDPESGQPMEQAPDGNGANAFDYYVDTEDELEKPWPATFERSISLLAGPTMDTDFIANVTKSPKITPNLARRRVSFYELYSYIIIEQLNVSTSHISICECTTFVLQNSTAKRILCHTRNVTRCRSNSTSKQS